jgi:hypothetical protein
MRNHFAGIHVYNYNISSNIENNIFDSKNMVEVMLFGKTYEQIRELILRENVKVISLIGKNSIINMAEYKRIYAKMRKFL